VKKQLDISTGKVRRGLVIEPEGSTMKPLDPLHLISLDPNPNQSSDQSRIWPSDSLLTLWLCIYSHL